MQTMLRKLKEKNRDDGGFTLIELLVVIVIIGILAGVVVFAVNGITDRGEQSACDADEQTLTVAQEAYYAQATPPAYAASDGALVTAGFLQDESDLFETTAIAGGADYTVNPEAGGGC